MLELSDCSAELFETEGQTIRFALAVSSSSVTNITPFADPRHLANQHQPRKREAATACRSRERAARHKI
jgi:hypothetical protein